MKRVVFVTSHYLRSDHKAGFHWLAESFWRRGWHATFFTESISWLSIVRRDERCKYPIVREAGRLLNVRERLDSFIWLTPYHPINLRNAFVNRLAAPLLALYAHFPLGEAKPAIAAADCFVFDSDHGLFLFDRFKKINPRARFVYRVSDHIPMMRHHPLLPAQEERILRQFDLVSVPARFLKKRWEGVPNVQWHPHGLQKSLFDQPHANPYQTPRPNVLYVGKHHFDADFVVRASTLFPDWSFHVIGDIGVLPRAANLHCYAERPFAELVPYLQHADIGLQSLRYSPGAESFTDTLKMYQYTYCRLPIVAPTFLKSDRPHVFYYRPGNDGSIRQALSDAARFERSKISTAEVHSWDEIAGKLAGTETYESERNAA
jgi:2-beta-glucuronyltransferase